MLSIYILFLFFLIYLLYHQGDYMLLSRKIMYFLSILLYLIILYLKYEFDYIIIKELFWYTLILNLSFIWHVLFLHTIFHLNFIPTIFYTNCSERREYICFIIAKISYLTSLLIISRSIHNLHDYLEKSRLKYKWNKKNIIMIELFNFLLLLLKIIYLILYYFNYKAHQYYNFILGNNKIDWKKMSKKDILLIIFKYIMIFGSTFIIMIITGVPRLYIIWIVIFIYKICWYISTYLIDKEAIKNKKWSKIKKEYCLNNLRFFVIRNNLYYSMETNNPYNDDRIFDKFTEPYKGHKFWSRVRKQIHETYGYSFAILSCSFIWSEELMAVLKYIPLEKGKNIKDKINILEDLKYKPFKYIKWDNICITLILLSLSSNFSAFHGHGLPRGSKYWKQYVDHLIDHFCNKFYQKEKKKKIIKEVYKELRKITIRNQFYKNEVENKLNVFVN